MIIKQGVFERFYCYFELIPGYEVYLVGGCVRDLILKRIPKDFDIITTAELKEVSLGGLSISLFFLA